MSSVTNKTALAWKQKLSALLSAVIVAGSLTAGIPAPAAHAADPGSKGIFTSAGDTPVNPTGATVVDSGLVIQNIDAGYLDGSGNLNGATVSVNGFLAGDLLQLGDDQGGAITGNYDAGRGILSLTGLAPVDSYQKALRSIAFTPAADSQVGREIAFTLGSVLPFGANGHFYKYVTQAAITWGDAETAASAVNMSYFGRQGYLATITTPEENDFIKSKTVAIGWIGAEDIARANGEARTEGTTGDWRWVTGPEGLSDGGSGLAFWNGYNQEAAHGPVAESYANWASGEPNDYAGAEYVAHIFADGTWNDYSPANNTIQGYIVEYGGMPTDDTTTQISAVKNIVAVDKSKLQAEADLSGGLIAEKDKYSPASWDNYQAALDEANQVLADATADQTKVNEALAKLQTAREALDERLKLVKVTVSNEEPNKATLTFNKDVDGELTADDFKGFTLNGQTVTAVEIDGETVKVTLSEPLAPGNVSVEYDPDQGGVAADGHPENELAPITADQQGGIAVDNGIVAVDKSKLQAEADLSGGLIAEKDKYSPASWDNYQAALDEANQVLADATADQTKVNEAQAKLQAAREALDERLKLVKVTVSNEEPNKATLTFNKDVDGELTADDFKGFTLNGQTVTAVEIDGETVKVTLSEPLAPGNVSVEYDPDLGGVAADGHPENELAPITADQQGGIAVDNGIVPLQLVTAKVEPGNKMRLVFNQDVDPDSIDLTGITVGGQPVTGPFEFDGNEVVVNLPAGYKAGDKLAYEDAAPSNVHQAGNENNKLGDIAETDLPYPLGDSNGKLTNDGFGLVNGDQAIDMQPAFDPSVPSGYTGSVPYEVSSIGLSPAAANAGGTVVKVNLNGEEVAAGDWSQLPLNVGVNTIKVGIYDKNHPDVLLGEYTVTINRAYPPVVSTPPTPAVEKITVDVEASGHGVVAQTEIERTTNTDGTKSDKVTFETAKALEAVEKTLAANSSAVRIVIPDAKDEVKDVRVDLPDAAAKAVKDAGLDLEIYTDNGMVTIPNASLAGINPDLYFRLVPIKKEDERKQVEERARTEQLVKDMMKGGNAYVVDRPMTIETNMSSRAVKITLPLSASHVPTEAQAKEAYLASLAVFVEHDDGTKELLKPTIGAYADGKLGLTITISKFSTFTILNVDDGTNGDGNGSSGNGAEGSHQAYMVGLPDGTFGPSVALTRAQMAAILSRVANAQTTAAAPDFPDVQATHWANSAIRWAAASGLMVGMPDGTFKPEQKITRAEMAAIIARWKKLEGGSGNGFSDAMEHWAANAISQVSQAGYMEGMPDGSFQPNKILTRAEAVTTINRVLGRGPLYGETQAAWSDVPMSHWAFYQIEEASRDHSYASRPEGGETIVP